MGLTAHRNRPATMRDFTGLLSDLDGYGRLVSTDTEWTRTTRKLRLWWEAPWSAAQYLDCKAWPHRFELTCAEVGRTEQVCCRFHLAMASKVGHASLVPECERFEALTKQYRRWYVAWIDKQHAAVEAAKGKKIPFPKRGRG